MLIIITIAIILLLIYQKGKKSGIEKGYFKKSKEINKENENNKHLTNLWIIAIVLLIIYLLS